ncbi:MAG: FliH/SctL family protein [Terracidiphilus sp.]
MEQVVELGNRLAGERDQFLRTIEQEVVRLALAIAARILRREAQTDPLFLVGAVRVALGQLAATMQVRLRVPAEESVLWAKTLAHIPNLKVKPTVVPDDCMRPGDCAIETEMGSVDLSLGAQLHQVETALTDGALAAKSGASADTFPQEKGGEL